MDFIYVKPIRGKDARGKEYDRIVRDPRTGKPIPQYGLKVPHDKYWRRRLADKDVEETSKPGKPAPAPKKAEDPKPSEGGES